MQSILHQIIKLNLSFIHPGKHLFIGLNEPHELSFFLSDSTLNSFEVAIDLVDDLTSIIAQLMVDFVHDGSCDPDSLTVFVPTRTVV